MCACPCACVFSFLFNVTLLPLWWINVRDYFNDYFIANFLEKVTVKEFRISTNIWWGYRLECGVSFFMTHAVITAYYTDNALNIASLLLFLAWSSSSATATISSTLMCFVIHQLLTQQVIDFVIPRQQWVSHVKHYYLSHCYSTAWDLLSVCLSVRAPTVAIFVRLW